MNSFTLTAVGNLARNPEAVAKGDITYTRFCLVGNDYAGKDDEGIPREIVTSLWFVAFGPLADSLVRNTRKGDQLMVEARVRANNWTDKQGEKQYDLEFVVQGFRFGAPGKIKREERDARREAHSNSDSTALHERGTNGGAGADHSGPATSVGVAANRNTSGANEGAGANQGGLSASNDAGANPGSSAANGAGPSRGGTSDSATASHGAAGSSANSAEKPSSSRGRRAAAPPP